MTKEHYFIPESSHYIKQYEKVLDHVASQNKGLLLNVKPEIIHEKNTDMAAVIIAVAQHKAEWINGLVFGIDFNFLKAPGENSFYTLPEWENLPAYRAWFAKMGDSLPMAMFFLKSWESRFYTITGDIINHEIVETEKPGTKEINTSQTALIFSAEQLARIHEKTAEACQLFMDYCYGTGFDARPAIDTIISEFQLKFDYETIEEEFLERKAEGLQYNMNFGGA